MTTRSIAFGPTAGTADTKAIVGTAYTFAVTGRIKQIRVVFDQAIADVGMQGILYLSFKKQTGPFEFVVGAISGKLTAGDASIPCQVIDVDIGYDNGEVVTVEMKPSETLADITVSLLCVE